MLQCELRNPNGQRVLMFARLLLGFEMSKSEQIAAP
jgi:hypothetical protein